MSVQIDQLFPKAVTKLTANEAKRVWAFLAKFLEDPAHPGLSLERVTKTKNQNLWSARISQELRAIVHKEGNDWQVLHADHHDAAYQWAMTKQVNRHSKTGALQIVEAPEVIEKQIPYLEQWNNQNAQTRSVDTQQSDIFSEHKDDYLVSLGVPNSWLPLLRKVKTEDVLLTVVFELPEDVSDRLLSLADGQLVAPPVPILEQPPAKRASEERFYVLNSNEDLLRMREAPLATWIAFLHHSQKKLAYGNFKGPLKVTGSAGTGKTVVALHRARHLARQGKRVLLTSYVTTLCENMERNLELLCTPEELALITVSTIHSQALSLIQSTGIQPIDSKKMERLIYQYYTAECPLDKSSLLVEWESVVQDQGVTCWSEYRKVSRKGRGIPLSVRARKQVWQVFSKVIDRLEARGLADWPTICRIARAHLTEGVVERPFDAVIVDELQDLRPQTIRLLPVLAGKGDNSLTLLGDDGQRIYSGRFSLKALGIDVVGRSHTLRINYRTTEQIRRFADRLLHNQSDDMDGSQESRKQTKSLLQGPDPYTQSFKTQAMERSFIAQKIGELHGDGLALDEIAIFSRTTRNLSLLETVLQSVNIPYHNLKQGSKTGAVNLGTMHRAKGLEFKVVFVAHVSDNQLPLSQVIAKVQDKQIREDLVVRERQLLYVSLTRARDEVFVGWTGAPSRFLEEVLTAPSVESG